MNEDDKMTVSKPKGSDQRCTLCNSRALVEIHLVRNPERYPHGPSITEFLCFHHALGLYGMLEDRLFGDE